MAQEIVQIIPWACIPSQLELRIVQSQKLVASLDYALCTSSSQSYLPDSPNILFHSYLSQSPSLLEEITQSCSSASQVCVVSFPRICFIFLNIFHAMQVSCLQIFEVFIYPNGFQENRILRN